MNVKDCFRILGISPDASLSEIQQAYKDLVQVWHPDKYNLPRLKAKAEAQQAVSAEEKKRQLKQINIAHDTLVKICSERALAPGAQARATSWAAKSRAKANRQAGGQEERKKKNGSLTVLKCSSDLFWMA